MDGRDSHRGDVAYHRARPQLPPGHPPLDTVRALHQTVVSLRAALERSRAELAELKQHVKDHNEQVKKIETSDGGSQTSLHYETNTRNKDNLLKTNVRQSHEELDIPRIEIVTPTASTVSSEDKNQQTSSKHYKKTRSETVTSNHTIPLKGLGGKFAMSSKIDVKIKVSSNVGQGSSSETESANTPRSDNNQNEEMEEDKTKTSEAGNEDDSGIKVRVTSEENLNITRSRDNVDVVRQSTDNLHLDVEDLSLRSMSDGDNSVFSDGVNTPLDGDNVDLPGKQENADRDVSGNESEEVDDIELIFTTDETKELSGLQEDLVSIAECEWPTPGVSGTPVLLRYQPLDTADPSESSDNFENENIENLNFQSVLAKNYSQNHRDDTNQRPTLQSSQSLLEPEPKFQEQKSMESTDSLSFDHLKSHSFDYTKSSSFERDSSLDQRDESFDQFDEQKEDVGSSNPNRLGRKWGQLSVYVETDISKCGILEDEPIPAAGARRNTCPNPQPYRPIIHREAIGRNNFTNRNLTSKFGRTPRLLRGEHQRPILTEKGGVKRENSAQTDISALPGQWRSESHLASKIIGGQYTLPSKFTLPEQYSKCALRLSDKTQEARRVLLSDINFTSMVPELSRSADHLCQESALGDSESQGYSNWLGGQFLRTPEYCRRITPSVSIASPGCTPCNCHLSCVRCSTSELNSCPKIRSSQSAFGYSKMARSRSRVTFKDSCHFRGSLPDLRTSYVCGGHSQSCSSRGFGFVRHGDSAGSTESLVDEAEDFLRRSIDGILTEDRPSTTARRRSETDVGAEGVPSRGSLPYLPRSPRDLKLGHYVKVIGGRGGGRVLTGKIRYVGTIAGTRTSGEHVGVQLTSPNGDSDGMFMGRRFFECESQHALFVPFNKVVMAWAP